MKKVPSGAFKLNRPRMSLLLTALYFLIEQPKGQTCINWDEDKRKY